MTPFDAYEPSADWTDNDFARTKAFAEITKSLEELDKLQPEPLLRGARELALDEIAGGTGDEEDDRKWTSLPPIAPEKSLTISQKSLEAQMGDLAEELASQVMAAVMDMVPQQVKDHFQELRPDIEGRIALRVGLTLQGELEVMQNDIVEKVQEQMKEAFAGEVGIAVIGVERKFEKLVESIARDHRLQVEQLAADHRAEVASLKTVLQNLPPTVVNVPSTPVSFTAEPSIIHFNVPSESIRVVAEAAPPRRTVTTKKIEYDESTMRPSSITEILTEQE
jgi:hypothetical protein